MAGGAAAIFNRKANSPLNFSHLLSRFRIYFRVLQTPIRLQKPEGVCSSTILQTNFAVAPLQKPETSKWQTGFRFACQFEKASPECIYFMCLLLCSKRTVSSTFPILYINQDSCGFEMCSESKDFHKKNSPENQSLPFCCRGVTTKEVEERADLLWLVPGHCQQEDPQHHGQPQCPSCSQALPHLGQEGWWPDCLSEIWKVCYHMFFSQRRLKTFLTH